MDTESKQLFCTWRLSGHGHYVRSPPTHDSKTISMQNVNKIWSSRIGWSKKCLLILSLCYNKIAKKKKNLSALSSFSRGLYCVKEKFSSVLWCLLWINSLLKVRSQIFLSFSSILLSSYHLSALILFWCVTKKHIQQRHLPTNAFALQSSSNADILRFTTILGNKNFFFSFILSSDICYENFSVRFYGILF